MKTDLSGIQQRYFAFPPKVDDLVHRRPQIPEEIILDLIEKNLPLNPCLVDVVNSLFHDPNTTEELWHRFGFRVPPPSIPTPEKVDLEQEVKAQMRTRKAKLSGLSQK